MNVVFRVVLVLTICSFCQVASERRRKPPIRYGAAKFVVNGQDCTGLLIAQDWLIVDPACIDETKNFKLTSLDGVPVTSDHVVDEVHFAHDRNDPNKRHYALLRTTEDITTEQFLYLPVIGKRTWENVRKSAQDCCSNQMIRDIINREVTKQTGVSELICSTDFEPSES